MFMTRFWLPEKYVEHRDGEERVEGAIATVHGKKAFARRMVSNRDSIPSGNQCFLHLKHSACCCTTVQNLPVERRMFVK